MRHIFKKNRTLVLTERFCGDGIDLDLGSGLLHPKLQKEGTRLWLGYVPAKGYNVWQDWKTPGEKKITSYLLARALSVEGRIFTGASGVPWEIFANWPCIFLFILGPFLAFFHVWKRGLLLFYLCEFIHLVVSFWFSRIGRSGYPLL